MFLVKQLPRERLAQTAVLVLITTFSLLFSCFEHPADLYFISSQQAATVPVGHSNIALSGTARQSSTTGRHVASLANDGLTLGFLTSTLGVTSATLTEVEMNPWWEIEFETRAQINAIQIHLPMHVCEGFWTDMNLTTCKDTTLDGHVSQGPTLLTIFDSRRLPRVRSLSMQNKNLIVITKFDTPMFSQRIRIQLTGPHQRQLALAEVLVEGQVSECTKRCVHGSCVDNNVCKCEPEYFGSDCSAHFLTTWSYLPFQMKVASNWWNPKLSEDLLREIKEMQEPHVCDAGTAGTSEIRYQAGFGSNFIQLAGLLAISLTSQRKAFVPGRLNFVEHSEKFCEGAPHTGLCFFEPWTNCTSSHLIIGPSVTDDQYIKSDDDGFWDVASHYERMGLFWYRTIFYSYMFRLSDRVQNAIQIEDVKQKIGFKHPIMGLHIRHGDSCYTTNRAGRCKRVPEYLTAVKNMNQMYEISRVFVSTDDPLVIEELNELSSAEFTFVYVRDIDRGQLAHGANQDIEKRMTAGSVDSEKMMLDTLLDLSLLAEADVFIGGLQSSFSRLALSFSVLQKRGIPPFLSLDGPWCPHWRMCCDVNPHTGDSRVC